MAVLLGMACLFAIAALIVWLFHMVDQPRGNDYNGKDM